MSIESMPRQKTQLNSEYAQRMNRVIDYLRGNLNRQVKLEELARVACFSEFHFHRIFGAVSQNFALLSSIERKNRALAQIAQRRVHPAGNALVAGRCAAPGGGVRRALQQRPAEQRHQLHHAEGHAGGAAAGDPHRAGFEVGSRPETTADSSAEGPAKSQDTEPIS